MDKVWNKIESRSLVYGGAWEDAQSTVKAKVFGVMVELSKDRVKHYLSDLYYDASWINEYVTGPIQFEWIARASGTFIGDVTRYVKDDEWDNSVRYRFDIRGDDHKWVLDIYESGLPEVPHICEECGVQGAKYVDYMQMWLCSDYCSGKAENRLNQVTKLPTDIDYSENEAYQLQLEKLCTSNDPTDHQGDTCPVHEDLGTNYRDAMQKEPVPYWGTEAAAPFVGSEEMGETEDYQIQLTDLGMKYRDSMQEEFQPYFSNDPLPESVKEAVAEQEVIPIDTATMDLLFGGGIFGEGNIPTLRNESTIETRKENSMNDVREMLESKLSDLTEKLEELESAERDIEDAKEIAQRNIDSVEEAINSLDLDLEDFYVSIDVSFDD